MGSSDLDIVGLGMCTLDVLMRMGEMPTWESPRRMLDFGLDGGGPVGTACVAAAHLGARVGYVGTTGNGIVGELKMRFMSEHGIDLSRVVQLDEPEAQVVGVYVHEQSGERVFSILDRFHSTQMPVSALDREYITSAEFLHLDGFYHDCAMQAARWMHEVDKRVCLDYHRTDDGRISASVINHSCCASQALAASDCFLMSAYSMGEGKVRWKLVTGMEGSLLSLVKSLRDAGCETEVEWIRAIRESNLLTKRQEEVLRTAVKEGYYEIPKRIYLEGLAKKMKVRPSTLGEILKRAEKAIIEDYLENR